MGEQAEAQAPDELRELERLEAQARAEEEAEEAAEGEWIGAGQAEPEPEEAAQISTEDLLAMALTGLFSVVASRAGPHWDLQPGESELLAAAWAPVMDRYAPGLNVGPVGAAVLTTGLVMGPKAKAHISYRAEQQRRAREAAARQAEEAAADAG